MVMLSVLLAFLFALYAFTVALPFGKAARLVAVRPAGQTLRARQLSPRGTCTIS
jgi:hypothetical protein